MVNLMSLVLAQEIGPLPELDVESGFFSLPKIILMLVFVFLWAWPAGWICRDARRLVLNELMWGLLVASTGVVGWFCWIMLPWYWIGFLFFLFLSFGGILAYILYRDSLVEEDDKLLKAANVMRVIRGEGEREFKVEQKVRLVSLGGMEVRIPSDEEQQKIYQVFQDLMFDGLWRRASDVYVQPTGENYRVLFRIDGVTNEYTTYDRKTGQAIIDYVKGAAELDVNERRQPQKARVIGQQINVDRKVELDFETAGSAAGERLTVRIRAEEAKFTVRDIGFTDEQAEAVQKITNAKEGLVVFGGMGKSGLSTTLYAFARTHDAYTQNIHSVESKPLMELDNITQNVYQSGSEQTFARLLQSVSRREPEIVLVDPCAEAETMQMISQIVGSKKRKIYTTMRASSVLSALSRTVRWIGDARLAGDLLIALSFQRLVRKLCPACKEAYRPNPDTLRKLNLSSKSAVTFYRPPSQPLVDKRGNPILCPTCQGTGYLGRTAVFELLVIDDQLRKAIQSGDPNSVRAAARKCGFKYWQEVAMDKVIAGITSVHEISRVSKEEQPQAKATT